ncbi:MAG TPA: hypothetical protein VNY52_05690 [Solirubrobacteraceae bacterium]|jgi:hypothetical protein|nr:hypothetical protein [Solirubrobacteraceae bacterium]
MQDKSNQNQAPPDEGTERLVMLQLLREDRAEWWSRGDVLSELYDVDPDSIGDAVVSLARVATVVLDGEHVRASASAWRLDALNMISV